MDGKDITYPTLQHAVYSLTAFLNVRDFFFRFSEDLGICCKLNIFFGGGGGKSCGWLDFGLRRFSVNVPFKNSSTQNQL